jgi:hypothetical protein
MSDGLFISFESPSAHELTRTSLVWKEVIGKTRPASLGPQSLQAPLNPPAPKPVGENVPVEEPLQDSSTKVFRSSSAKSTSVSNSNDKVTSMETKISSPQFTLYGPVTPPAQSKTSPSNISGKLNTTPGSGSLLKKGLGDSILKKNKTTTGSRSECKI